MTFPPDSQEHVISTFLNASRGISLAHHYRRRSGASSHHHPHRHSSSNRRSSRHSFATQHNIPGKLTFQILMYAQVFVAGMLVALLLVDAVVKQSPSRSHTSPNPSESSSNDTIPNYLFYKNTNETEQNEKLVFMIKGVQKHKCIQMLDPLGEPMQMHMNITEHSANPFFMKGSYYEDDQCLSKLSNFTFYSQEYIDQQKFSELDFKTQIMTGSKSIWLVYQPLLVTVWDYFCSVLLFLGKTFLIYMKNLRFVATVYFCSMAFFIQAYRQAMRS